MSRTPLRVALLGAGTVGGSVVRAFLEYPERLVPSDGAPLELAGIAVRDIEAARARGLPADLLTDAPAHLVASSAVDVVVELMGGDEPAHTLIAAALGAGKPVVTANKHVLARYGAELEAVARRTGARLRFEAAVGGGIPVLSPIASDLAANAVTRVRGVLNGTTNYILTAMADGSSYDEALADAQVLGYAEADPSGDVEGGDAVNKLVILARLAFGLWLDPVAIDRRPPTARGLGRPGISGVTDDEMEGANALGYTIKLLASAAREGSAGPLAASVLPTAVPSNSPFGWTDGIVNRIEIEATPVGTIRIAGPGAGGAATSSAILGDLIAISRGLSSTWAGLQPAVQPPSEPTPPLAGPRRWYAFVPAVEPAALPAALEDAASVEFEDGTALRTERLTLDEARAALRAILPPDADVTLYPVDD